MDRPRHAYVGVAEDALSLQAASAQLTVTGTLHVTETNSTGEVMNYTITES